MRIPNCFVGAHEPVLSDQKSDYLSLWLYRWCGCPHHRRSGSAHHSMLKNIDGGPLGGGVRDLGAPMINAKKH
jgi:hypothetical protein